MQYTKVLFNGPITYVAKFRVLFRKSYPPLNTDA